MAEFLTMFVDLLGKTAEVLEKHKEWAVVAFLLLLNMVQYLYARKDRREYLTIGDRREEAVRTQLSTVINNMVDDATERDKSISNLLETRHQQFIDVFERVTDALSSNEHAAEGLADRVRELEDRLEDVDRRCDERTRGKKPSVRDTGKFRKEGAQS